MDTRAVALIMAMADAVAAGAEELTALDRAIGDADHGINMRRGFEALRARAADIAAMPAPAALHEAGMTLVLSIGGASGPLYGSFLMGMAHAAGTDAPLAHQLAGGLEAVKRRGRCDAGAKTMLDVMIPVVEAVAAGAGTRGARMAADAGFAATRGMIAKRGRAAYLGVRSRGHLDPGAGSSRLLVHAICNVLEA